MINILNLDLFNQEISFKLCYSYIAYIVKEKVSDLNYIVSTPDRRKNNQLCHINLLKSYVNRDKSNVQCANIVSPFRQSCNNVCDTQNSQDFEN